MSDKIIDNQTNRSCCILGSADVREKISQCCNDDSGILMLIGLDTCAKQNDPEVFACFEGILKESVSENDIIGKADSGEYVVFFRFQIDPLFPGKFTVSLNEGIEKAENMNGIGVWTGSVFVPENGKDYDELYKLAMKALESVKAEKKHDAAVYSQYSKFSEWRRDLAAASKLFDENDISNGACRIGMNGFGPIYRYFVRYVQSYCRSAFKMLFTLSCIKEPYNGMAYISERFSELIAQKLRKSDLLVQLSDDQFFLVLPEITEQDAHKLAQRIVSIWKNSDFSDGIELQYEAEQIPINIDGQKHYRSSDM